MVAVEAGLHFYHSTTAFYEVASEQNELERAANSTAGGLIGLYGRAVTSLRYLAEAGGMKF